jgi:hypothetical protein
VGALRRTHFVGFVNDNERGATGANFISDILLLIFEGLIYKGEK